MTEQVEDHAPRVNYVSVMVLVKFQVSKYINCKHEASGYTVILYLNSSENEHKIFLYLDKCKKEGQGCGRGIECCDGLRCKFDRLVDDYVCQKDASGNVQSEWINKSPLVFLLSQPYCIHLFTFI